MRGESEKGLGDILYFNTLKPFFALTPQYHYKSGHRNSLILAIKHQIQHEHININT